LYEDYRRTSRINALEASNVGSAILNLMGKMPHWEGSASELMNELDQHLPRTTSRKNFPSSPRSMSGQLRRIMPNLVEVGIEVDLPEGARRSKGGKVARIISLTNTNASEAGWDKDSLPF
jgi:hypothetical protein